MITDLFNINMTELYSFVDFGIFPTLKPFDVNIYFLVYYFYLCVDHCNDGLIMLHSLLIELFHFSCLYIIF